MKKPIHRRRRPVRRARRARKVLFPLGRLLATPGALDLLDRHAVDGVELLQRHQRGDWGEVSPEDAAANKFAVEHCLRIVSSYRIGTTDKVWVITESDHRLTTILLPEEY